MFYRHLTDSLNITYGEYAASCSENRLTFRMELRKDFKKPNSGSITALRSRPKFIFSQEVSDTKVQEKQEEWFSLSSFNQQIGSPEHVSARSRASKMIFLINWGCPCHTSPPMLPSPPSAV